MVNQTISVSRVALTSVNGGTCVVPYVTSVPGMIVNGGGTGCNLLVGSTMGTSYDNVAITMGGSGYIVGDILHIPGTSLAGGASPTNDFTAMVTTVSRFNGTVYTITSITGTPFAAFVSSLNGYPTTSGSGANLTISMNNGVYSATVISGGTNFIAGNILTIPGNLLGGLTPVNDMTCAVNTVSNGGISTLGSFSTNAINNFSQIVFDLPSSIFKNVVYLEWVNSYGLQDAVFVQINEFNQAGVTSGNFQYWRYVTPNTINNVPDHMAIQLLTPNNYTKFTVTLMGSNGKPIQQVTNWTIELVVYSQV